MLFQTIYEIFPDDIEQEKLYELLQKGYDNIIQRVRFYPALFPVMMAGYNATLNEMTDVAYIVNTSSEIGFKKIRNFKYCSLLNETYDTEQTGGTLTVGILTETNYGFNTTAYERCTQVPYIYRSGDKLISDDDETLFMIVAEPYPYPFIYTGGNEYEYEYRYSIRWMIDTYGESNLYMDDFIGLMMTMQALSYYYEEKKDTYKATVINTAVVFALNTHNDNFASMPDNYTDEGELEDDGGLNE